MLDLTGYRLTFDEEFNRRSISQSAGTTTWGDIRTEWRYDANSDIGFGSSSFVDPASGYDPFRVANGALTITANPDRTSSGYPGSWESGLITTQGGFSQTYGYFEIRADFSSQIGAWDAFWLLPNHAVPDPNHAGGWQELDVVEHYGSNDKGVYSTIHTTDPQNGIPWQQNRQVYSELANASGYHTYGVNWQADFITFYVDGQMVGRQATPSDMHGPMYLLANLATQTTQSSDNNANVAGVPLTSSIDYIRVYSNASTAVSVPLDTVSSPDGRDPGLYGATSATRSSTATQTQGQSVSGTQTTGDPGHLDIARLYSAALDRAPDAVGLQRWLDIYDTQVPTAARAQGVYVSLAQTTLASNGLSIAGGFTHSPEFVGRYGSMDDTGYVNQLYQNVLHRAPDQAGVERWLQLMHSGDASGVHYSREMVLIGIAESPENIARTADMVLYV